MSEAIKITEPGAYRTRDGRKAVILGQNPAMAIPWAGFIDGEEGLRTWSHGGICKVQKTGDLDIVAVWVDPRRAKVFLYAGGARVYAVSAPIMDPVASGVLLIGTAWVTESEWAEEGDKP